MEASLRGSRLSLQQERLWTFYQGSPSQGYVTQGMVVVEGPLRVERLRAAVQQLVERHEILRTVFRALPGMDVPMQVVGDAEFVWCHTSLEPSSEQEQQQAVELMFTSLQEEPLDLQHGPALHVHVVTSPARHSFIIVRLPALCADNFTLPALVAELARAYEGQSTVDEEEEPLQYADVAAWQNELLQEEEAREHDTFWHHMNLASLETLRLPHELQMEKSVLTPEAYALSRDVACEQALTDAAAQLNVSKESLLLAAWQLFLARLTNQEDLVTGVAYSGRSYEELQCALGLYTRVIPFPTVVDPLTSFAQLARQVDLTAKEIEQRQLYFTWAQMQSASPTIVPTTFAYLADVNTIEATDLRFRLINITSHTEPFVLKLEVVDHHGSLQMQLHFDRNHFARQTIISFATLFVTLLEQALSQLDTPVQELRLLSTEQEVQILQQFSGEAINFPARTLVDFFEQQVECVPDAPAVTSGGVTLSYRQLNAWANRLAWTLRERGVRANVLVGLCTQRSVEMLVGLLAILKAGGAYMALDPQLPTSRLQYQLQDAQALLVVSQVSVQDVLADIQVDVVQLESFQQEDDASHEENLAVDIKQEDLAYVIYTSGSTGVPKGVLIQHSNVSNYIQALCKQLAWQPGWQFATVSTLAADLGNTVIFGSLITGGCLHILDYETVTSAQRWSDYVRSHPIDVLKIVPSHMSALLVASDQSELSTLLPRKQLIMGGEALSASLLARLVQPGVTCEIINHYGPTETTIGVLVNQLGSVLEEWTQQREAVIPIGRPLSNIEVAIVNAGGQLMPTGVAGELYIAGAGVSRGYLNQPEQTAAHFVEVSWGNRTSKRYYRTGDLAKYREDGTIEFVGRVDTQVKIRGYRVELGEIERVLGEHEQVRESVVLLREDNPGEQRLIAYVVPKTQAKVESAALLEFVQQCLPGYMVPGAVVIMTTLPLTPNGKIDRRHLPEPEEIIPAVSQQYEAPHNQVEETLASIWEEVLNMPRVSVRDNFFTLGGHSLLATQIISRIRTAFGVELPILKLFEEPTVVGVAQHISELLMQGGDGVEEQGQHKDILPVARDQALPLSFAQQRLWFLDQLQPGSLAYNKHFALRLSGELNCDALEASLSEIVRRHESLRTTFSMEGEQPVQVIHEAHPLHLERITLLEESEAAREEKAQQLIKRCVEQPFDLTRGPLLRAHLFQLEETEHVMVLTMHHIVSDAWSNAIFMRELTQLYAAFVKGESANLPELSIQYADFAAWQQQWIQGPVLEKHLAYWREQLRNVAMLDLPIDRARPVVPSGHGLHVPFTFSSELQDKLNALSQESGTTLFMTLLAAFQVLLARYSGQTDIAVGSPIANRSHTEIEGLIGFFVNMLVLRSNLSENPTFAQILNQVWETTLQAFAHQDLPFERIVEELQPDRDLSINPLYQVSFSLQNTPLAQLDLPGITFQPIVSLEATTKVDLELHMWESPEGLQGTLIYNMDLFVPSTIENLIEHFQILIRGYLFRSEQRDW